jgi:hypothetical protein
VKQIWQGRMFEVASRYGESAPLATTCCNACRTCATTNIAMLALGALAVAGNGVGRFARRLRPART